MEMENILIIVLTLCIIYSSLPSYYKIGLLIHRA